ncbi:hypothetical protein PENTCL1PPCAC_4525, partial [Pristionchus entomophagus]
QVWYAENHELGTGCNGTIVFRGIRVDLEGGEDADFASHREVAVKRVQKRFLPQLEIEMLLRCRAHQNIITYFFTESDNNFRYLVLELCDASLYDYVEKKMTIWQPISSNSP